MMKEEDTISIGGASICSTTSSIDVSVPHKRHPVQSLDSHVEQHQQQHQHQIAPPHVAKRSSSPLMIETIRFMQVTDLSMLEEESSNDVVPAETMFECCVCLEEREIGTLCDALACKCTCCRGCIKVHFTMRIREGNVSSLPCPGCGDDVSASRLRSVLTPATFQKYLQLSSMELQNRRVREDPNLCWCPTPDCVTIVSRPKEDEGKNITCPTCCKDFCFECKGPAHKASRSCEDARRKLTKKDELAFLKWAKHSTKACPECKALIERNKQDGSQDCNHMTCSKCKTEFCWLCGRKVPPIGHFDITNVLGCPGLQFSGPDVHFSRRLAAKTRALKLKSASGAKTTVKVIGYGVLLILAAPIAAISVVPFATYKGVMKCRSKQT